MTWGRSRSASLPSKYYINHHHHYYQTPAATPQQLPTPASTPWRGLAGLPSVYSQGTPALVSQPTQLNAPAVVPQAPVWSTPAVCTWLGTPMSTSAPLTSITPAAVVEPLPHGTPQVLSVFNTGSVGPLTPSSSFLSTPFPSTPSSSFSFSSGLCLEPHRRTRTKARRNRGEAMKPTQGHPLHLNLTNIEWDIRTPPTEGVFWTDSGDLDKLRNNALAILPWYSRARIVMCFDVGSFQADWATKTTLAYFSNYHNSGGHLWAWAVALPSENEPLTVKAVLDVMQSFWYEPLAQNEVQYATTMGLYQPAIYANAARAAIVGEHWSFRDDARLRRIDLLGRSIVFKGFSISRMDGDHIILVYTLHWNP